MNKIAKAQLAGMIDHTLLKPTATKQQIEQLCQEAKTYGFASVCVNPVWVSTAAHYLDGTNVKVCTVVGFPLGAATATTKAFEAREAIQNGASEIDMVINLGAVKSGAWELVDKEIAMVAKETNSNVVLKVIIETSLLLAEEKLKATELVKAKGAAYVKTSTGFADGGATVEDVRLLASVAGTQMAVKASGGVRDLETALAMLAAGAKRLGTSSGVELMKQLERSGS